MLVLNQDTQEEGCTFRISQKTKNYLIAFFGFYEHDMYENFNEFLSELGIDKISNSENLETFEMGNSYALEAYSGCDRRTFDVTIILPHNFEKKEEALSWFTSKVKNSDYMVKKKISEIDVLDGDKLLASIKKEINHTNKTEMINNMFKEEMIILKNRMLESFEDKESKKIIENKFRKF